MPKRVSTKQLLMACQMSFDGKSNREIASEFGFTEATVSNWRKLKIWQEFEVELLRCIQKTCLKPRKRLPHRNLSINDPIARGTHTRRQTGSFVM